MIRTLLHCRGVRIDTPGIADAEGGMIRDGRIYGEVTVFHGCQAEADEWLDDMAGLIWSGLLEPVFGEEIELGVVSEAG